MRTLFIILLVAIAMLFACGDAPIETQGSSTSGELEAARAADDWGPGLAPASIPPLDGSGIGSFRIQQCELSHYLADDPIVYPEQPGASHLHMFMGNIVTNAFTTQASLEAGQTTCPGGVRNLSSYWIPALLDSAGQVVDPFDFWIYYKAGGGTQDPTQVQAVPEGLRMLGGGNLRMPYAAGARWQGCALNDGNYRTMTDCLNGQTLELRITFPQCWDGVNLDSADHRSHMRAPSSGQCPTSHPVMLPEITYTFRWQVDDATGSQHWRLSSDLATDVAGQSAHADYWGAWKHDVAEAYTQHCIRGRRNCNNGNLGNGFQLVFP